MTDENRIQELWRLASSSLESLEWKIALTALEEIILIQPENPQAFYNKGIANCKLGRLDQALLDIRASLKLKPDYAPAIAALQSIKGALEKGRADIPSTFKTPAQSPIVSQNPTEFSPLCETTAIYKLGRKGIRKILPIAEMYATAGLTIWASLSLLMIIFTYGRTTMGLGGGFFGLIIVFGIFATSTYRFINAPQKWIDPKTENDPEKDVYDSMKTVAEQGELPIPRISIAEDNPDINAYTYGLTPDTARVCVTKGFMDHVKPDKEELNAVLAHELSHIHHKDCAISTLLRFPIWLMDKIRVGMEYAKWYSGFILKGFAECAGAFGIIGVMMVFGMLALMLYLSVMIFLAGAAIFVCVFFLNAFEREREYLADLYAGQIMGSPEPIARTLAKLEIAANKFQEEIEKKNKDRKEGEQWDLTVETPHEAYDPSELISESLSKPPSFASSFTKGEFFSDHPLTSKRIFYLHNPLSRKRFLSRMYESLCRFSAKALNPSDASREIPFNKMILLSAFVGISISILPIARRWWCDTLMVLIVLGGGLALGYMAKRDAWNGEQFMQRVILSAFLSATTLLVLGAVFLNPMTILFPLVFFILLLTYGGMGLTGIKLALRAQQSKAARAPDAL